MINFIIKAVAGTALALVFLGVVGYGGARLYHVGPGNVTVEGEKLAQAYAVATEDAPAAAAAPAELTWDEAVAAADAARGEKVFGKCKACHKLDGKNAVGPHLDGVMGRPVASVEGFNYSDAMKGHASDSPAWDPVSLEEYVADPKGAVPGNKMSFAGLNKIQDRADLVAYLETVQ